MFSELKSLGRSIQLSHIGRIGPGGSVWKILTERYGPEIEFCRLGERSLDEISRFFYDLDFGVSTAPLALIGKSSCVAAMVDHGLPVIVNRDGVHFRGIPRTDPVSDLLIPRLTPTPSPRAGGKARTEDTEGTKDKEVFWW